MKKHNIIILSALGLALVAFFIFFVVLMAQPIAYDFKYVGQSANSNESYSIIFKRNGTCITSNYQDGKISSSEEGIFFVLSDKVAVFSFKDRQFTAYYKMGAFALRSGSFTFQSKSAHAWSIVSGVMTLFFLTIFIYYCVRIRVRGNLQVK